MIEDLTNIPKLPAVFGPARQVAYVVEDIDVAMAQWHEAHGVGPFLVARNAVPLSNAYYRGQRAEKATVHLGFAYVGDMQLELIQLVGDTPSLYKEALDRGDRGVNHYAVCVEDFPVAYNWALDHGFSAVVDAGVDGLARMSYVEQVVSDRRLILEVIEWNALTRPYFTTIEKMVKSADSAKLVHEFNLADITPKFAAFTQMVKFFIKKLFGRVKQTRRPAATPVST